MPPISVRLVAAAKGLAVGVLTLAISLAAAYAGGARSLSACPFEEGGIVQPHCNEELGGLGILYLLVVVLFALPLALGPLLAWAFQLPRPSLYLIAPFVACLVDVLAPLGLPDLVPFAVYPVIAALSSGRRREIPDPPWPPWPPSPASPADPDPPTNGAQNA
jgi:hypothetical protein